MRWVIAALAVAALAACGPVSVSGDGAESSGDSPGGYTLEVRADESQQTYLVRAPDGRVVGARAAEGNSLLMDEQALARLGDPPRLLTEDTPEVFALRLPGVDISVAADEDNPNSESARVRVNAGGRQVHVDADEGGPGDADDRANVMITGANEEEARDFINDAEELSQEVKQQMLAGLGLE